MSYKIVEVKFLGTSDKTYFFSTELNLELGEWYDIFTKESGGYSSPVKVVKEHSSTYLYNCSMYKEIIAAKPVCFYAKIDKTKPSVTIDSNKNKDGFIDQVWFNPVKGTTVVRWIDGSKTMVRCQEGEIFDKEKGLALCYMKRTLDNKSSFNEILKKWCPVEVEETEEVEEIEARKPWSEFSSGILDTAVTGSINCSICADDVRGLDDLLEDNMTQIQTKVEEYKAEIDKDLDALSDRIDQEIGERITQDNRIEKRVENVEEKVEEKVNKIESNLNCTKKEEFYVGELDLNQLIGCIFPYNKGE